MVGARGAPSSATAAAAATVHGRELTTLVLGGSAVGTMRKGVKTSVDSVKVPNMEQEIGSWDSVLLENLSEESFINNLHQRYKRDLIYTYIGTFLVALNPYKTLQIYSPEQVRKYATKSLFQLPPHIFALANSAHQFLLNYNEDQCIIMAGECGSGKTESSHMIVHFLTQLSEMRRSRAPIFSLRGSNPSSRQSTPKHSTINRVGSSFESATGAGAGRLDSIMKYNSSSRQQKCSHEKTVEFDLISHHKSSENLPAMANYGFMSMGGTPKCLKHSNQSISRSTEGNEFPTKSTLKSSTGSATVGSSSSACPRHNCTSSHAELNRMCSASGASPSPSLQKRSMLRCCHQNSNSSTRSIHKSSSSIALTYEHGMSSSSPPTYHRRPLAKSISKEVYIRDLELQKMRERVAQAEMFLEAMGNAVTVKNANSSRFGKFFDIEFDYKGDPVGGHLTLYMLEKSRVTTRPAGERNFHIFYQLLSGADIQLLKSLKLQRNIDKYELLKNSFANEDDRTNFAYSKRSLEILGFGQDEILSIFTILAVVLKLGNLTFIPTTNIDGSEGCEISNEYELDEIAQLLQLDNQLLFNCLTRLGDHWDQLEPDGTEIDACYASRLKFTLCRTLYGRLFAWIVTRVNDALKLKPNPGTAGSGSRGKTIGLLDFYGFESLEKNSFDQLAINYCNERLQQHFIKNVLKHQQDLYVNEGLDWIRIEFFDNAPICELIDKPCFGILHLLDEPQVVNDGLLLTRLHQCCAGHTNFLARDATLPSNCFQVRHFEGPVVYTTNGFIEKNMDLLPKHISSCLFQSDLLIASCLFPEGNPKRHSSRKPSSLSTNLRTSLQTLLKLLEQRSNHYIFCIKPNELKQPKMFELGLVQHQVRYLCLMPLINLWRNGHCFNMVHARFVQRYKLLCQYTWPHFNGTIVDGVALIIRSVPLPGAEFTIGRKKVFIRSPRTVYELDEFRKVRLNELAVLIQKTYRCYTKRKQYLALRQSQLIIASYWRIWREREKIRIVEFRKQAQWAVQVIGRFFVLLKTREFLLTLLLRLPHDNMSPICLDWPSAPTFLAETSQLLRTIFHRWRCYKYRKSFDQPARNRMREKVTASIIFKDRKVSYPRSVAHPFHGDYIRLRQNIQWKRVSCEHNDQYVVFADIINKIARSSGKFIPILLVISTNSMLLLDQKTMQIKYRIPASEIYRMSLSPYFDDIAVIHIRADTYCSSNMSDRSESPTGCLFQSEIGKKKGDFVFQTAHSIEIVTKLFLVIQNATAKSPEVTISTDFEANFGGQTVIFTFKCGGLVDNPYNQTRVTRKGNRMEVIV
ncbi:unconventional myosin-Ib-like isoform X3 [Anopheles albimanus]|uniref:Myosin motor domain-containing protein n=1 Tax=Anopheles albimanus TaxID=7167 RepID=A0A182FAE8_ANOAL|nr:unconventional myosin-Ib-like isoform X3 [Anopheles albimanus]